VFEFAERHPDWVMPVALCQVLFHASEVFEIRVALRLITGQPPSVLAAFVLESVNRTITVAFQFVPMWLGVDEAGTGLIAAAIGISPAAGITVALARNGRIVLWTVIGRSGGRRCGQRSSLLCQPRRVSPCASRLARSECSHSE
jgi:hypothetical protein